MTDILHMFSGNPLATFIGKKIEQATRPELEADDWALNLEICDLINASDDDAKDAARAIKRRLQQTEQEHEFAVTNRTLTVLETCVSNCSRRFHVLVLSKDFVLDLVKLIGPKNNPPIELQERVLRMIQRWAEAFKGHSDLQGVVAVYNDLRAKGVTFPAPDAASQVPIQTPQRSVSPRHPSGLDGVLAAPAHLGAGAGASAGSPQPPDGPLILEGEGYNKITADLGVVQSSIDMLNDIMTVLASSGGADESDWKLAADLEATCRQMKERIVDLIERVANEDLTVELLRLNDDLNNLFVKYNRLVKNSFRKSSQDQAATAAVAANAIPTPSSTDSNMVLPQPAPPKATTSNQQSNELSLIDFNADDASGGDKAATKQPEVDPFGAIILPKPQATPSSNSEPPPVDKFRGLSLNSASSTNTPAGTLPEEVSSVREQDFAELEKWLTTDSSDRNLNSFQSSLQSPQFEDFLATRASAASTNDKTKDSQKKPEPSV